jgi:hypothetical protein
MNIQHDQRPERRLGRHAIVIGGSIAGLLTIRALAPHTDLTRVGMRDETPAGHDKR